ncbi:hypothetical protein EB74_23220, partial [Mycobacterium sp. SWH-M5]
ARAARLRATRRRVAGLLERGRLLDAVSCVDEALGLGPDATMESVRSAHHSLSTRRTVRSRRAR